MKTSYQRRARRKRGLANWRMIRFADDFVVMVHGERRHAEALRQEVTGVLATLGLRLAPEKTRVVHIDEGFDFLSVTIRRMRKRGTQQAVRLHQAVQEGHPGRQGQGFGENVQVNPIRNPMLIQQHQPDQAREVRDHHRHGVAKAVFEHGRPPCVEPDHALAAA